MQGLLLSWMVLRTEADFNGTTADARFDLLAINKTPNSSFTLRAYVTLSRIPNQTVESHLW